jgi:hypothetical protein
MCVPCVFRITHTAVLCSSSPYHLPARRGRGRHARDEDDEDAELLRDEEADGGASQVHRLQVQPSILTGGTLREYQLQGLNWLIHLYDNGINGILADEMVRQRAGSLWSSCQSGVGWQQWQGEVDGSWYVCAGTAVRAVPSAAAGWSLWCWGIGLAAAAAPAGLAVLCL